MVDEGSRATEGTLCGTNPSSKGSFNVWTGRYQNQEVERAYQFFFEATFGSISRACFYYLLILFQVLLYATYISFRDFAFRKSDRVFVSTLLAVMVLIFISFLLRLLLKKVPQHNHELLWIATSLLITATTLIQKYSCPTWLPYEGIILWRKHIPDVSFPALLHSVLGLSFLHFSTVPWPRSAFYASVFVAIEGACIGLVAHSDYIGILVLVIYIWGFVIALISAILTNQVRREEFLSTAMLEFELQKLSEEQKTSNSLKRALFPPQIADRLIQSHSATTNTTATTTTTASLLGSNNTNGFSSAILQILNEPSIADLYENATVVWVIVDGIEKIKPFNLQLDILSRFFIAAERIGESLSATKIKPFGVSIIFVCGIPTKANENHIAKACNLSLALQRLLVSFSEYKKIDCLSLRIGIANGPVVAGVIRTSKPKYDIYGYTVNVASRLANCAPSNAIVATKTVAQTQKHNFKLMKHITVVEGIGKILVFKLITSYYDRQIPIKFNCNPEQCAIPGSVPSQVNFEQIARTLRSKADPVLSLFAMRFKSYAVHQLWADNYMIKIFPQIRWISWAVFVGLATYWAIGFKNAARDAKIMEGVIVISLLIPFVFSFFNWFKVHRTFFGIILTICASLIVLSEFHLWITEDWVDATSSAILVFYIWVHYVRLPIYATFLLSLSMILINVTLLFLNRLNWGAFAISISLIAVIGPSHYSFERERKKVFFYNLNSRKYKQEVIAEKAQTRSLILSVVPLKVVQQLLTANSTDSYLAEFIPCGTALVCKIVGFEDLLRIYSASEAVSLLSSLFSHLDKLVAFRGLEPLKTNADEYIVVGNMLNDIPDDHASRIVGLASDILSSLAIFNHSNRNFANATPISLRIGIHSDSLLSGIIRTKTFLFDVWGNIIPYAEQVCSMALPGQILITQTTNKLIAKHFKTQPFVSNLDIGNNSQLHLFTLSASEFICPCFSLDTSEDGSLVDIIHVTNTNSCSSPSPSNNNVCEMSDNWSSVPAEDQQQQQQQQQDAQNKKPPIVTPTPPADYGVFEGAGNVVTKESAISHEFAFAETTSNTTTTNTPKTPHATPIVPTEPERFLERFLL